MAFFEESFDLEPVISDNEEVQETGPAGPADDSLDAQMSEVERRLEVASYYRLILNQSIFTDDSQISKIVESEIRGFIRERLAVLLNIQEHAPKSETASTFTALEIEALKAIAKKVISTKTLNESIVKGAEPPTPSKPKPQPPSLRKVAVPQTAKTVAKKTTTMVTKQPASEAQETKPTKTEHEKPKMRQVQKTSANWSPHSAPIPTAQEYATLSAIRASEAANNAISNNLIGQMVAGTISGNTVTQK